MLLSGKIYCIQCYPRFLRIPFSLPFWNKVINACKKLVPEGTPSIIDGFILNKCMPIDFIKIVSKPINVSLGILEKCARRKSRFRSNNTQSEMNTRMITASYTIMRRDPLNNIWVVTVQACVRWLSLSACTISRTDDLMTFISDGLMAAMI